MRHMEAPRSLPGDPRGGIDRTLGSVLDTTKPAGKQSSDVIVARLRKNRGGEVVQIALTKFNGYDLVDLRVMAATATGYTPTRRGISVKAAMLPDLVKALQAALVEAEARGLL